MKKSKLIVMYSSLLLLFLIFVGCGKKEHNASQKALSCAQQAIDVANDYLSGDISYDRASRKLDSLSTDMHYVSDESDIETNEHHFDDSSIYVCILSLRNDITYDNYKNDSESYDEISDDIKTLEEYCK